MKFSKSKFNKGFTLVEILVGTSLLAVIIGVGAMGLYNVSKEIKLKNAVNVIYKLQAAHRVYETINDLTAGNPDWNASNFSSCYYATTGVFRKVENYADIWTKKNNDFFYFGKQIPASEPIINQAGVTHLLKNVPSEYKFCMDVSAEKKPTYPSTSIQDGANFIDEWLSTTVKPAGVLYYNFAKTNAQLYTSFNRNDPSLLISEAEAQAKAQ